jgi:threonine/homoserine/homoserine lactone efflux protein
VAATILFLTTVALAGHLLERVLDERLTLWLNRAVGLFLIGFAVKLAADLLFGA